MICTSPREDVGASSSHPSTASVFSTALPLLRSSLAHLREAVKSSHCSSPFVPKSWELIRAELLLGEPEDVWGVSSCCNEACTRLEGPCELEAKTLSCGGLCGARYCSRACQVQAWRAGHMTNCLAMKDYGLQRRSVEEVSPSQVSYHDLSFLLLKTCLFKAPLFFTDYFGAYLRSINQLIIPHITFSVNFIHCTSKFYPHALSNSQN